MINFFFFLFVFKCICIYLFLLVNYIEMVGLINFKIIELLIDDTFKKKFRFNASQIFKKFKSNVPGIEKIFNIF